MGAGARGEAAGADHGDLAVAPRGRGPCAGQGPRQPDVSVVTAIDALAGGCAGSFAHLPPPATKGLQKCGQSGSTDVQDGLGETSLTEGAIAQETSETIPDIA